MLAIVYYLNLEKQKRVNYYNELDDFAQSGPLWQRRRPGVLSLAINQLRGREAW